LQLDERGADIRFGSQLFACRSFPKGNHSFYCGFPKVPRFPAVSRCIQVMHQRTAFGMLGFAVRRGHSTVRVVVEVMNYQSAECNVRFAGQST
jgi:hypothetical protein